MAALAIFIFLFLFIVIFLVVSYVLLNDARLLQIPSRVLKYSPKRWTDQEILSTFTRLQSNPKSIHSVLPPRTGRKYIVTGGAGFLGGWIVRHLLERGEDPRKIRVLDIRLPTRRDLTTGKAKDVDWRVCDVSNAEAVHAAFRDTWPSSTAHTDTQDKNEDNEITVFHTAACIRFYERAASLVPFSSRINVVGTQNVLSAARSVGCSVFVSTSSGSVALRRSRFWLWPWEREPPYFVQFFGDTDANEEDRLDNNIIPRKHEEFFSNYAYTKKQGESLILRANNTPSSHGRTLHTGCVRPGNGIYGPGGDVLLGAALVRETNPTWIKRIVQNFVYVENASYAHLCYERKLIELSNGKDKDIKTERKETKDVSGRAYYIADAGPPPTYGDVYHALSVLSHNRATFPSFSPTLMLALSHVVELVYLSRTALVSGILSASGRIEHLGTIFLPLSLQKSLASALQCLPKLIPNIPSELLNLQPSLFPLVLVHLIFNNSLAYSDLDYNPPYTTIEGVCALVDAFEKSGREEEARQRSGGGIGLGLGIGKKLKLGPGGLGGLGLRKRTTGSIPTLVTESDDGVMPK
ncbi:hypothetical protein ACEPAF_2533 [Sanghuangporus sanghuang]